MHSTRNALTRGARTNWWTVALVWSVPGTIASVLAVVGPWMYATLGVTRRDWIFAALQFPRYVLWAPLTPLIFAAVRRYPVRKPGLARSIAIHSGIALVCVIFVEMLSAGLQLIFMMNNVSSRPGFSL